MELKELISKFKKVGEKNVVGVMVTTIYGEEYNIVTNFNNPILNAPTNTSLEEYLKTCLGNTIFSIYNTEKFISKYGEYLRVTEYAPITLAYLLGRKTLNIEFYQATQI